MVIKRQDYEILYHIEFHIPTYNISHIITINLELVAVTFCLDAHHLTRSICHKNVQDPMLNDITKHN
jgi:hypothetical protein